MISTKKLEKLIRKEQKRAEKEAADGKQRKAEAVPTEAAPAQDAASSEKVLKKEKRRFMSRAEKEAAGGGKKQRAEDKAEEPTVTAATTLPTEAARPAEDAASGKVAKRIYKEEPCSDQGHWGKDGEWVYPADREICCSLCKEPFTFAGSDQAWYAKRGLYAPARCASCIAKKKEARHAKQKTGKSGEGRCYRCGKTGHGSAECAEEKSEVKACYVCGSSAHLSRNCPQAASAKKANTGCFTCGSLLHMSRECPDRSAPVCFNCGSEGHGMKACPQPQRTEGPCFAFAKGQCFRKKCVFQH